MILNVLEKELLEKSCLLKSTLITTMWYILFHNVVGLIRKTWFRVAPCRGDLSIMTWRHFSQISLQNKNISCLIACPLSYLSQFSSTCKFVNFTEVGKHYAHCLN